MVEMGAKVTIYCESCRNTDPKHTIGVEYEPGHPERYDGVSEWVCNLCGARTGRWSRKILQDGEAETRFGT